MTRRDGLFALWVSGLTLAVPGTLLALSPIDEARATFGVLLGWGLALVIMLPSYLLLARAVSAENPHRFVRNFMLGMLLRMFATVIAVAAFYVTVEDAPLRSFLLSFFLGYGSLTAVELTLTMRGTNGHTTKEQRA
ncbi:MAG: hypothetical protein ACYTG2_17390 [Planctomycetota bacterium]|jgi:hypothetical protein